MSFLDAKVDLTLTIFCQSELELAREYLVDLLEWEDPAWLRKPVGYLARFWLSDDLYSVCYLTHFARLFNRLERGGVTTLSKPVLFKKLHQLLRKTPQKAAFEETLSELELAAFLADKAGAVLLEPRILDMTEPERPQLAPKNKKGEKVIDLAVPLATQIMFVEVTVLNFEALDEWAREANRLANLIHSSLWLENFSRAIRLQLPFPTPPGLASEPVLTELLEKVSSQVEGDISIPLNSTGSLRLEWHTPGQVRDRDRVITFERQNKEIGFSKGEVSCLIALQYQTEFDERLFKSLRNSLKIKKAQCQPQISPLLIIRPGSPLLAVDGLGYLIEKRLWSNSRYSWLSAIAIFTLRAGFGIDEPGHALLIKANPKARFPFGEDAQQFLNELEFGPTVLPD